MSTTENELILSRLIPASPEKVFQAWTQPELLKEWFNPRPWTTPSADLDVRSGGNFHIVMRDPEGKDFPMKGVYLEVIPNERLVFTDAYTEAWKPSEKPFMTAIITFEKEGGGTRYTAQARHWNKEDCVAHEKMGFHEGWGKCADQLTALLASRK